MPVQPITGQRRYPNGEGVSAGDRRVLYLGALILLAAWAVHDGLGIALPSSRVLEFTGHMVPVLTLWLGLYHARTRRP